jgi:hypothetical protein
MLGDIVTEDPAASVRTDVPSTVIAQLPVMSSGTFTFTSFDSVIVPEHATVPVNCTDPAVSPTLAPVRLENRPLNVTFPAPDFVSDPPIESAGPKEASAPYDTSRVLPLGTVTVQLPVTADCTVTTALLIVGQELNVADDLNVVATAMENVDDAPMLTAPLNVTAPLAYKFTVLPVSVATARLN